MTFQGWSMVIGPCACDDRCACSDRWSVVDKRWSMIDGWWSMCAFLHHLIWNSNSSVVKCTYATAGSTPEAQLVLLFPVLRSMCTSCGREYLQCSSVFTTCVWRMCAYFVPSVRKYKRCLFISILYTSGEEWCVREFSVEQRQRHALPCCALPYTAVYVTQPWGCFPSSIARQSRGCQYRAICTSSESSRRDASNADVLGTVAILAVEVSSMENRLRGVWCSPSDTGRCYYLKLDVEFCVCVRVL